MKIAATQRHIETLYNAGARYTVFLQGPPGIGKSEAAIGAAKNLGINIVQWQATIEDPLELPGLPAVVNGEAVRLQFKHKIPGNCICACENCLKREHRTCKAESRCKGAGILLIDEINSAPTLTQAALYSLIWDGKLGDSILGEDWMIVATGNRAEDRGVVQRMPTPLVSRMEHITVEPDIDGWLSLMAGMDGDIMVRAFVKTRQELFVTFKADIPGPFACPRTWKMVSDLMLAYGKGDVPREAIAGWIGEAPAHEFDMYRKMAADLEDPEYVIKHPNEAKIPKDPGPKYALLTGLASRATFENYGNILTYLNRLDPEFAVYCVMTSREVEKGKQARMSADQKKSYKALVSTDAFKKWAIQHKELIIGDE